MRFNFLIVTIIVLVLDYLLTIAIGDWRVVIIAGIIGGALYNRLLRSFLAGFLGSLLAWLALMLPIILQKTNQELLKIIASIVGFPQEMLIGLVIIIPSLIGGLACLVVSSIRVLISR